MTTSKDKIKDFGTAASVLYGIDKWEYHGFGSNHIYFYEKSGKRYVLRIGEEEHQDQDMVEAEIEWLIRLSKEGISLSKPIQSIHGKYVERLVVNNTAIIVVSYEYARGSGVDNNPEKWSDQLIYNWGKLTGTMHKVSKSYQPAKKGRMDFLDEWLPEAEELMEQGSPELAKQILASFNAIRDYPKDKDGYGLIHGDLHAWNFYVENDELTVFDFDAASYSYFITDPTASIYYPIYMHNWESDEKRNAFIKRFFRLYWKGYETQNTLDKYWREQINVFLKLRDAALYVSIAEDSRELLSVRDRQILERIESRMLGNESYVDVQGILSS